LRSNEEEMKFGLEIFDIDPQTYPELTLVEKEIGLLTDCWEIKNEWDKQWEQWKDIQFYQLDIDDMEDSSIQYKRKINDFEKDIREWGVYTFMKNEFETFRNTMPLLYELRSDAMRDRHWKELRFEVKDDFDKDSDEFNLEKLFALNLLSHKEKIQEIADNAKKQLKIEKMLETIDYCWRHSKDTELIIVKNKSKADNEEYYEIKQTDKIMALIEEHGVQLSNEKSSPYYKEFAP